MNVAVVTVSDSRSRGEAVDTGGPLVGELVEQAGWKVVARELVSDDQPALEQTLVSLVDRGDVALIVTTGGTGLSPRDTTPEATRAVIDREAPGIAEHMRAAGTSVTPFAALSRQVVGLRGRVLIVNLPGSEKAIRECFGAVEEILPHAVRIAQGAA
jgi:molybdopterin adenylyltransferase